MIQAAGAQKLTDDERLFKAAFIYNFAKFTSWPDDTWTNDDAPLILCTAGQDELIEDLKRLGGKIVKGRSVSIRPVKKQAAPGSCHVLYIAQSEKKRYAKILESVRKKPVLTVSELPRFGSSGGIVELYREKNKTRFIINIDSSREAGLTLSSRLLRLAVVVDQDTTP